MNESGITTFYDSVCGQPVFQAPMGRSFEDWVADTHEHGWPSFRAEEVVQGNIYIDNTTAMGVYSACGTYIGSFLPDDQGDRYCIDLCCISGHA